MLLETVESLKEEIKQLKEEKSAALAAVTCDEKSPEATASLALPTAQENDEPWQTVNSKKKQGRKRKKGKGKERKDGLATQTTSIPIAKVASNGQTGSQSGLMQKTCKIQQDC